MTKLIPNWLYINQHLTLIFPDVIQMPKGFSVHLIFSYWKQIGLILVIFNSVLIYSKLKWFVTDEIQEETNFTKKNVIYFGMGRANRQQ